MISVAQEMETPANAFSPPTWLGDLRELHPPETAAQHLVQRVPVARGSDRVGHVVENLSGQSYDSAEAVYVLDEEGRLQGLVRLRDLLGIAKKHQIREVMHAKPPRVLPGEDQEKLALLALKHSLAAVPVVDESGRLLGVVPALALIDILRREHWEDLHRLAGILRETNHAHEALEGRPWRRLRGRLPWLLVGLVGSIVAAFLMAAFEQSLQRQLAIAFFVPAIVYLADAIGTQTEAIVVRYLSMGHAPLGRLLRGETFTGLLLGLCLSLLLFPVVMLGFGDARLAVAVALAVFVAGRVCRRAGPALPVAAVVERQRPGLWQRPGGDHHPGCPQPGDLPGRGHPAGRVSGEHARPRMKRGSDHGSCATTRCSGRRRVRFSVPIPPLAEVGSAKRRQAVWQRSRNCLAQPSGALLAEAGTWEPVEDLTNDVYTVTEASP